MRKRKYVKLNEKSFSVMIVPNNNNKIFEKIQTFA